MEIYAVSPVIVRFGAFKNVTSCGIANFTVTFW